MILHCFFVDFCCCSLLKHWYCVCCPFWWVRSSINCQWHFYFLKAHPQLTSHTCVEYCTSSGVSGCFNTSLLGTIHHLKFTVNVVSNFGPLNPVSVLVFLTWHFFAEISVCFSDWYICCICWSTFFFPWPLLWQGLSCPAGTLFPLWYVMRVGFIPLCPVFYFTFSCVFGAQ